MNAKPNYGKHITKHGCEDSEKKRELCKKRIIRSTRMQNVAQKINFVQ